MLCKAHNCPCLGSIQGLCNYHSGALPQDWPRITDVLRNNLRLLKAIHWCFMVGSTKPDDYVRETLGRLNESYPDLTPKDTESAVVWAYRAMRWLNQETKQISYGKEAARIRLLKLREDVRRINLENQIE